MTAMINDYLWDTEFSKLFARCFERYKSGDKDYTKYYANEDLAFLYSIGYKPREFFDFVEDLAEHGEPSATSAVLIAAVRRDYFMTIQKGELSENELTPDALPPREDELGGYQWLPRIIAKARAKLRGELHPDIMYSCGGDRNFLSSHGIHPADFLRFVWAAREHDDAIVQYVSAHSDEIED